LIFHSSSKRYDIESRKTEKIKSVCSEDFVEVRKVVLNQWKHWWEWKYVPISFVPGSCRALFPPRGSYHFVEPTFLAIKYVYIISFCGVNFFQARHSGPIFCRSELPSPNTSFYRISHIPAAKDLIYAGANIFLGPKWCVEY
jgi:hypothetical protein